MTDNNVVKTRGFKVKLDLEKDKDTITYIDKFVADTAKFGMTHQNVLKLMVNEFMKKFQNGAVDVLMNDETSVQYQDRIHELELELANVREQLRLKNQSTTQSYTRCDDKRDSDDKSHLVALLSAGDNDVLRFVFLFVSYKLALEVHTRLSVFLDILKSSAGHALSVADLDVLYDENVIRVVDKIIHSPIADGLASELLGVAMVLKEKMVSGQMGGSFFDTILVECGSAIASIENEIGKSVLGNGDDLSLHNIIDEFKKIYVL